MMTRFQVKITHNSFAGFFIKRFGTVKYELILLHLFLAALITNSSPKIWLNLLPIFCQNNKGYGPFEYHVKDISTQ